MFQLIKFSRWLMPRACILCAQNSQRSLNICQACEDDLPWLSKVCECCAGFLPVETSLTICIGCIKNPPLFSKTIALFAYQEPIAKLISHLKFQNKLIYAQLLGELFVQKLLLMASYQSLPDYIIPVPLHPKRLQERGYNQAKELARPIAKQLGIPIALHGQRIVATEAQMGLPAFQRKNNVKNAFAKITTPMQGKHVAILDDVVTTGSTVAELSKVLKKAGVKQIDIWCMAKTNIK